MMKRHQHNRRAEIERVFKFIEANPHWKSADLCRTLGIKSSSLASYADTLRQEGRIKRVSIDNGLGRLYWVVGIDESTITPNGNERDEPVRIYSSSWEPMKLPPDPLIDALCRR